MKQLKICITGPSGTGKTTLAQYISQTYKIPFISTSTKPLWEKHGINSHEELIKMALENPQKGMDFQLEVLEYRKKLLEGEHEFVSDRSPICNIVYFLMQNSFMVSEQACKEYINLCKQAMSMFNGIIFTPFTKDVILENDGARVNNKFYQETTNAVYTYATSLMVPELSKIYGVSMPWDMTTRKALTSNLVANIIKDDKA